MLEETTAALAAGVGHRDRAPRDRQSPVQALVARSEVFGRFRTDRVEPAIEMRSVHHLYKVVNMWPLVRPYWY